MQCVLLTATARSLQRRASQAYSHSFTRLPSASISAFDQSWKGPLDFTEMFESLHGSELEVDAIHRVIDSFNLACEDLSLRILRVGLKYAVDEVAR